MTYTKSELIEDLVLGAVLAILGYRFSERFRRTRGVTPWHLPSAAWAVLLFFVPPVAVLYLIACITTRSRTGPQGWNGPQAGWGQPQGGPPPPQSWNAPPSGWTQPPPQGWDAPAPGAPAPGAPGYSQSPAGGWVAPPPPGGWDAPPPPGTVFPGFAPPGSSEPAPPAPPPSPRNWLADPSGRHELRYWDGTKFTEHVADAGKITIDPL
jgi:hypothetical protein